MQSSQYVSNEISDCFTKTAANIITYFEGDERKEKLEQLKEIVKNNSIQVDKLNDARDLKEQLFDMYEDNDQDNETTDIIQEYKKAISKLKKQKSKSQRVVEFEGQLKALMHGKEGNEQNDDDEDFQLSGGYVNVIDPISKKRIVDPVKNSICGHTYDRETITGLLKINKNTRCPVVGCISKEFVSLTNLKGDIVTQTYLDQNPE